MKNEDTKKRLDEGKQDSQIPKRIVSVFFILFTFLGIPLYGQIYLNGFVKYEEFPTITGPEQIYSSFIDNDAKSDFIVFSGGKSAALHLSSNNYKIRYLSLPYSISKIYKLFSDASGVVCLFISRSDKLAGIIKIYKSGKYQVLNKLAFNSYPTDFSVYKKGNKRFVLIFGENFDGLELLVIENNKMSTVHLIEKHLIKDAEFIDIDYDGLIDICCFDLIENEIEILLNNRSGGFEPVRAITCPQPLESYNIIDYNFDGFFDLVCNFGNSIEISYGDSVSTFSRCEKIIGFENDVIEKFKFADFNRDGYYDIAALMGADSSRLIKVAFSRQGCELNAPLDFFSGNIYDIDVAGYNPAELVFLAEDAIKIISRTPNINELKIGLTPYKLFPSREGNDFFVYDSINQCINFICDNYRKIYPVNISHYFNEMKYYKNGDETILYLYEKGKRSLEIIALNTEDGSYRNTLIYSQIPVEDLLITPIVSVAYPKTTIFSNYNNQLRLVEYSFKDIRYLSSEPSVIAENVYGFSISGNTVFYLGKDENGGPALKAYDTELLSTKKINTDTFLKEGNNFSIFSFINKKNENIVILEQGNNLAVIYKDKIKKINLSFVEGDHKLFLASDRLIGSYLYLWKDNKELYRTGPLEDFSNNRFYLVDTDIAKEFFVNYDKNSNEVIYNLDRPNGVIKLIWKN